MITVYTDGASSGNPGPGWAMYVIEKSESAGSAPRVVQNRVRLELCTNNEAEYLAVVHALKQLLSERNLIENESTIPFLLDSKLVVEQLNGRWKVKEARMREFILQIHTLLNEVKTPVTFTYIPREKNKADQLKYD